MTLMTLKDGSLVSPGVIAENDVDLVLRGVEYGFGLDGPQSRCLYACKHGHSAFFLNKDDPDADPVKYMADLVEEVTDFFTWLVRPEGKLRWKNGALILETKT